MAYSTTGTFAATGQSDPVSLARPGLLRLHISGTFVGTVLLETSHDGGSTWYTTETYTNTDAPLDKVVEAPSPSVAQRLNCSIYTSGTVEYFLGM